MSVTGLPATYLIYKSQVHYCTVPCDVYKNGMHRADFAGNASFSSSAIICFQPLPSTFPDEFSMDMMNISVLFFKIPSV